MAVERRHSWPTYVVYIFAASAALLIEGAVSEKTLYEDYMEFRTIVKLDKMVETVRRYSKTSDEVKEFLGRLKDPKIEEYAQWFYQQKPLHKALAYLEQHKVPGYKVLNQLVSVLGWPPCTRPQRRRRLARSVHRLAQDLRDCIPPLDVFEFYSRKMKTSKDFRGFDKILRSDEFNNMVLAAMEHKGYKKLTKILDEGGIDVDSFRRSLTIMFGWGRREKKKHEGDLITTLLFNFFN